VLLLAWARAPRWGPEYVSVDTVVDGTGVGPLLVGFSASGTARGGPDTAPAAGGTPLAATGSAGSESTAVSPPPFSGDVSRGPLGKRLHRCRSHLWHRFVHRYVNLGDPGHNQLNIFPLQVGRNLGVESKRELFVDRTVGEERGAQGPQPSQMVNASIGVATMPTGKR